MTINQDERIASLPKDVQAGLATMDPEQQAAWLDSLERAQQGKPKKPKQSNRIVTDPEAPYGRFPDGSPKAKPGRKAAENPGARTEERPLRFKRSDVDLEALIAALPDGDEELQLTSYPDAPELTQSDTESATESATHSAPESAPESASETDREAYEQELAKAVEGAGLTLAGREVVSRFEVTGRRRIDAPEDDPLAVASVVECGPYRATCDEREYFLECLEEGAWRTVNSSLDVTGLAMYFAFRRIVVDDFGRAIAGVPRYRPSRQAYLDQRLSRGPKLSRSDLEARKRDLRDELARQRAARAGQDKGSASWL